MGTAKTSLLVVLLALLLVGLSRPASAQTPTPDPTATLEPTPTATPAPSPTASLELVAVATEVALMRGEIISATVELSKYQVQTAFTQTVNAYLTLACALGILVLVLVRR